MEARVRHLASFIIDIFIYLQVGKHLRLVEINLNNCEIFNGDEISLHSLLYLFLTAICVTVCTGDTFNFGHNIISFTSVVTPHFSRISSFLTLSLRVISFLIRLSTALIDLTSVLFLPYPRLTFFLFNIEKSKSKNFYKSYIKRFILF